MRPRKLSPLEKAALDWWRAHRPIEWTARQHIDNPTVNVLPRGADASYRIAVMAAKLEDLTLEGKVTA